MKIRDFILSLVSWFILLVTVSCSDELGGERAPISSESNLHVLVPTVLSSRGTRTDDASGLPTYNATVDECWINDLTLYAFPVPTGNGNDGKLLVETLPAPLATMMAEPNVANYQLTIEPGTYHIYVVANMNKVLSGQTIKTENELKNIVLGYGVGAEPGMPVSTNIPMIYEPEKDAAGNLAEIVITAAGDKYTEVAANLKFTCVKVKLNLIFDPSNADDFGGKAFSINSISAKKLSPFTHLYWGGKFETPTWTKNEDKEAYKEGFPSPLYDSQLSEGPAVYYTDWTDNRSASATNNNDDIKGTGKATEDPVNAAGKWLFQQTYYLPERYISSESDRSYLTINGKVGGSVDNNYRIDLGHKKDGTSTVPVFPRGTFYEITGAIKTLGNMELDCKVSIKPWETVPITADFNHTTLWVSKTEASVTSTTNDIILYKSNAAVVEFGCDTKINSKDIIIGTKRGKDANGNDSIEFRVNPNIPIKDYAQLEGTAKFWLKANNLKKYIDVHYDVKPYLDVTKELVIYYNSTDPDKNKRTIKWDTNLGGIVLDRKTDTKGKSTITMSISESDAAAGTFTVTAENDPETTTIHEFKVRSKDKVTSKDDEYKFQTVRVKVSPPIGDYRIYFRAINDRNKYTDGNEEPFQGIKPEGGNNNWSDGWNANSTNTDDPTPKYHHIYVYTQIGETTQDGSGNIKQKRWIYTAVQDAPDGKDRDNWPGEQMVADKTNTGWYYKDFAVDMKPVRKFPSDEEDRKMKPGETLIMFNNCENVDAGYTKHRCPHHMEPGIPLFDYEDHEGWIVYDPTSDPIWHMYDDMPEIEDIAITIYTQERTWGWWKQYGIKGSGSFTIEDKTTGTETKGNSWTLKDVGNGWWKTVINLKAIKGEHNKDIRINLQNINILLFDGNSFKDDTGYYADGEWYQGKPKGVTE
jgi:hypothetical protein